MAPPDQAMPPLLARRPILRIVEQHAEDVAHLWQLRDQAVHGPHHDLASLATLEDRLGASIEGTLVAGEVGRQALAEAETVSTASGVFALAVHAALSERERIDWWQATVALAALGPEPARGLAAALGWMSAAAAADRIQALAAMEAPWLRRASVAASAMHGTATRSSLEVALGDVQPMVVKRALRAVGELGQRALLGRVLALGRSEDGETAFWAAHSGCLLGELRSAGRLPELAGAGGPLAPRALGLALLVSRSDRGEQLLAASAGKAATARVASAAAPGLGTPWTIELLIAQMSDPALARLAGDSFAIITGAELSVNKLEGVAPGDFASGPTDDPADEDVALDPDEGLSWPDRDAVQQWWKKESKRFSRSERYLGGGPITDDAVLLEVLRTGRPRARSLAALARTLRHPGEALFDIRAPAHRQRAALRARPPGAPR